MLKGPQLHSGINDTSKCTIDSCNIAVWYCEGVEKVWSIENISVLNRKRNDIEGFVIIACDMKRGSANVLFPPPHVFKVTQERSVP